ncbi:hypothetical protein N072000002_p10290 (plasmid) [Clostridium tetani]|uniref:Uncharacterized protein n=1 Tax=Clostridium tetani TaxID=1513 RepID=A0A4V1LEC2_CLOTA|nr:hypothetical protein [Clostridium tetani]RXI44282.1 hypothetical protein DP130_13465 [Clostridium tetani]BDR82470.1 hypothetical protein K234311028_p10290 [Clostridium tetani]BDR90860.1 hypothetical protein N072000002_p10290 [Clostridium tetani]
MSKVFIGKILYYLVISFLTSKLIFGKVEIIKFNSHYSLVINQIMYIIISFVNLYFILLAYKQEKNNKH